MISDPAPNVPKLKQFTEAVDTFIGMVGGVLCVKKVYVGSAGTHRNYAGMVAKDR